jgi:acyl-CoA thioesterase FadM
LPFRVQFQTRHTDTYAATGFVHAGVLLALTELAYAAFERAAGLSKPPHIVSVEVRTRAEYRTPLPWQDGVVIEVQTLAAHESGFTQSFTLRNAATDRRVASIEHDWVWLDTSTGRAVPLDTDVQSALLSSVE